jgi:hypothetical protein
MNKKEIRIMSIRRAFALAVMTAAAGCSHGAGSPSLPAASSPMTDNAATSNVASNHRAIVKAKLVIKVPAKKHHRRGRHPAYVSPATASLQYAVDGGATQKVAISASNPACTVVGAISYLQCAIDLNLAVGTHTLSFVTLDANGIALSANTNVSDKVVSGVANQIPVVLGGDAASILVEPLDQYVTGSQSTGFSIVGHAPKAFSIVTLDADRNIIVGPGAPEPAVQATPANMTMSAPAPSTPNIWTFTSTFNATSAAPGLSALSITATPVPNSEGVQITASSEFNLYQPAVVFVNSCTSACTIGAFDEQGNAQTLPVGAFPNLPVAIGAMTYDPNNGWIYVTGLDNTVKAYDSQGNQQTLTGTFPNVASPYGIVFDSSNKLLYVTNLGASSPANAVTAYDEQGNQQTLTGSWANASGPRGIAYDPHTNWLYLCDSTSTVTAYDAQGNQQTLAAFSFNSLQYLKYAFGIAYANGWLFVTTQQYQALAFDGQGRGEENVGGLKMAQGLAYDPNDGYMYVADNTLNTVRAYDVFSASSAPVTLTGAFPGLTNIQDVVVAP